MFRVFIDHWPKLKDSHWGSKVFTVRPQKAIFTKNPRRWSSPECPVLCVLMTRLPVTAAWSLCISCLASLSCDRRVWLSATSTLSHVTSHVTLLHPVTCHVTHLHPVTCHVTHLHPVTCHVTRSYQCVIVTHQDFIILPRRRNQYYIRILTCYIHP